MFETSSVIDSFFLIIAKFLKNKGKKKKKNTKIIFLDI